MKNTETIHFLDPPPELRCSDKSLFHILPVPFESTVSYGGGTALGPRAILEASGQVEFFNGFDEPVEHGIFTHPLPETMPEEPEEMIRQVQNQVKEVFGQHSIPVILGGEHTVSIGAFRALAEMTETPFGIVHFDAHADLRDNYENNPYSHACVMHRAVDLRIPIIQFGVRSLCRQEADLRKRLRIPHHDGTELHLSGLPDPTLPADFPQLIYITFDIDVLDPSLVPATGTPDPGGLFWYSAVTLLERVISGRQVAGFDMVELAPVAGLHASDFIAAKLVYTIIGLICKYGKK